MKWPLVELGEICEFKYGKSLPAKSRKAGLISVYGSNGKVGSHDKPITVGSSIIIGRKGSFGEVHFSNESCWPIDTSYYIDQTCTKQYLGWLRHTLPLLGLTGLNRAAAVPGLNREDAYRQKLLLPPLDEQRRIAAILDKASDQRVKGRSALKKLAKAEGALFSKIQVDASRSTVSLRELGWDFYAGKNIVSSDGSDHPVNRVIKVSAASSGTFLPAESKPLPLNYNPPEKHRINPRDILFCRASGSLDLIGRTAVVVKSSDLFLPDKVWRLELPENREMERRYALGILRSEIFLNHVRSNASGAAGVKNISKKRVLDFQTHLPSIESQALFAETAVALDSKIDLMRIRVEQFEELFVTLARRAFRGEL